MVEDRQEPIGWRIRQEFIDNLHRSPDSQRAMCNLCRFDRSNQGARKDISRLQIEPVQSGRYLRHTLRSPFGQRTIRIHPSPLIPLHRNAMPQQHTIHHSSFFVKIAL